MVSNICLNPIFAHLDFWFVVSFFMRDSDKIIPYRKPPVSVKWCLLVISSFTILKSFNLFTLELSFTVVLLLKSNLISWIIFLITVSLILVVVVSSMFPALLPRTIGGLENRLGVDPFDIGPWAYPLLIGNFVIFSLIILYFKNKLPMLFKKSINFIFNFEISQAVSLLIIVVLVGFYIVLNINQITNDSFDDDFHRVVKGWLESFSLTNFDAGLGYYAMLILETASMKIFGNYKVIPFMSSISVLIFTYLLTAAITKKRFAGILSLIIVLQSSVFNFFDTSVSYAYFWVSFYLLSLYLIYKRNIFSSIPYVLSIMSKPITIFFLPMSFFFVYRSNMDTKKKKQLLAAYILTAVLVGILIQSNILGTKNETYSDRTFGVGQLNSHKLVSGLNSIHSSLRLDGFVLLFLLPVVVGLFISSKKGYEHADSVLFLIFGILVTAPILSGFTSLLNEPYRFIPLIVFFAIGVGILFSKRN